MPGRSTAGPTFASAEARSGRSTANVIDCPPLVGGSNASEIVGVTPSSRRRLAQNATSMMASRSAASGSALRFVRPRRRAAARCFAKCSRTLEATARAAGYPGSLMTAPRIIAGVPEPATAALRVRGLRKAYRDVVAVDGIDLDVPRGQCFGLLGPNGAGKTTTIEICEGLTPPDSGEVL